MKSRYKNRRLPDLDVPARTGDPFDEFNIEHDASGRAFDLWEAPSPDDAVFQRELRDALDRGLASLDPRQEVWIRLYYGIPFPAGAQRRRYSTPANSAFSSADYQSCAMAVVPAYERTLEDIAEISGYTRERVRQVIEKGLKKLRHRRDDLQDVMRPELEEARRARKERQRRRNKQLRARANKRLQKPAPSEHQLPAKRPRKQRAHKPAEPKDPIDEALKKIDVYADLWTRLHYGIPIDKKNRRRYPVQLDAKGRYLAPYKPDYPRSLEEISKMVKWPVDVVRRVVDRGLQAIKRRTGVELKFVPRSDKETE
jgi:RNA polymerase sigma factor (sigma-70 family)